MKILLFGMNHNSAPLAVRERFAVEDPGPLLQKLVAAEEIEEAVVVSTCNRVDLVVTTHQVDAARHRLRHFFSHDLGRDAPLPEGGRVEDYLYEYEGRDAVSHVMRVASSIDSMVVGEPQILGQMKDAYRAGVECGSCGPVLSRLFQRAFATAKRVRNETAIAERPVSVARVAVDLSRQIFEEFTDKTALLIGAGEMIELALQALVHEGLGKMRVANRTRANAEELARRFGASAHGLDELDTLIAEADVVLTCIAVDDPILDKQRLTTALRARGHRPVFLIDIGVPRNIAPDVNDLDNAYLYDIDDLQEVAARNAEERRREAEHGERIVVEEEQRFDGWLVALQAVPTIRHLRARADSIRTDALRRFSGSSNMDSEQLERVDTLTRLIVNKILHAPLSRLRSERDREEGLAVLEVARELFALDEVEPHGPEAHHVSGSSSAAAGGRLPSDDDGSDDPRE
jgi:glutamyl-tRNA reductase